MIEIFKGRSQIIDYELKADLPSGYTSLIFTIKKYSSGDVLLSSEDVAHIPQTKKGAISLVDAQTAPLPLGKLLGELQAVVSGGENYVVIKPFEIFVAAPLRNG